MAQQFNTLNNTVRKLRKVPGTRSLKPSKLNASSTDLHIWGTVPTSLPVNGSYPWFERTDMTQTTVCKGFSTELVGQHHQNLSSNEIPARILIERIGNREWNIEVDRQPSPRQPKANMFTQLKSVAHPLTFIPNDLLQDIFFKSGRFGPLTPSSLRQVISRPMQRMLRLIFPESKADFVPPKPAPLDPAPVYPSQIRQNLILVNGDVHAALALESNRVLTTHLPANIEAQHWQQKFLMEEENFSEYRYQKDAQISSLQSQLDHCWRLYRVKLSKNKSRDENPFITNKQFIPRIDTAIADPELGGYGTLLSVSEGSSEFQEDGVMEYPLPGKTPETNFDLSDKLPEAVSFENLSPNVNHYPVQRAATDRIHFNPSYSSSQFRSDEFNIVFAWGDEWNSVPNLSLPLFDIPDLEVCFHERRNKRWGQVFPDEFRVNGF